MSVRDSRDRVNSFYGKYGKRVFDLLISIPSIIILLPVFIIIAALIKLESSGPIVFSQERIGRYGRPFRIYKFRTMVKNAPEIGTSITSANDPRITKVGKFLRKFKIDEILQIINVIKGDMSIIGPRPEIKKYIDMFKEDYKEILRIRPGMTDYASITFRNEEEFLSKFSNIEEGYIKEVLPQKIELYKRYLKDMSLITDVKIFFKTIWKVLR